MQISAGGFLGLPGSCVRHKENLVMCCKVTGVSQGNGPSSTSVKYHSPLRGGSFSCSSAFTDIDRTDC